MYRNVKSPSHTNFRLMNSIHSYIEETYHEAFFSLRISFVAHVARVLAFVALERRPLVSKP